jgi:hypothetical protein
LPGSKSITVHSKANYPLVKDQLVPVRHRPATAVPGILDPPIRLNEAGHSTSASPTFKSRRGNP